MTYLFTIHYDGITERDISDNEYDEAAVLWYDHEKRCDIIEAVGSEPYAAYEYAIDNSDMLLSISYVEIFLDGRWQNWHEYDDGVKEAMKGVVKSHIAATFKSD